MADAGSALESQQAIAAKIPYENIDAEQKGLGLALGTFYHAAEVSKQRQQLENSLLATQLRLGEESRWHNIEMQNMEQNTAIKLQSMNDLAESRANMFAATGERLAAEKAKVDLAVEKYHNTASDTAGLMQAFSGVEPGSQDFYKNYFTALEKYPHANDRTAEKVLGDAHNRSGARQYDKLNADMREFGMEVNDTVWRGTQSANRVDLTPLVNDNFWRDQYVNKNTGEFGGPNQAFVTDPKTGKKTPDSEWEPTGNKFMQIFGVDPNTGKAMPRVDPGTGQPLFSTLSLTELNSKRQRYQDLLKRKGEIAPQIATDIVTPVVAPSYIGHVVASDLSNQVTLAQQALAPGSGATPRQQAGARAFLQSQGQSNGQ